MIHFIVNLGARSGLGHTIWKSVEKELNTKKVDYQVHFTQYPCHATQIVSDITSDKKTHIIVVMGGDGSIGEAINGILDPSLITLGYVPIGSGNDFARGMRIPSDVSAALDRILNCHTLRLLDLGLLHYNDKKHRFIVSSGIGYDADVCHHVSGSALKSFLNRFGLGKFAYVGLSIDRLIHCKPQQMTIVMDDTKTLHFKKAYFATAMNLPFEGGGCKFCPEAKPDDGFLDLIVVADVPKIRAIPILLTVFFGNHVHLKGVHIYRCKKADISSALALPLHSDGEPLNSAHQIKWTFENSRIKIIV